MNMKGQIITISEISRNASIGHVKNIVAQSEGIQIAAVNLMFSGNLEASQLQQCTSDSTFFGPLRF